MVKTGGEGTISSAQSHYRTVPFLKTARFDSGALPPSNSASSPNSGMKWFTSFFFVVGIQLCLYGLAQGIGMLFTGMIAAAIPYVVESIVYDRTKQWIEALTSAKAVHQKLSLFIESAPVISWHVNSYHYDHHRGSKGKSHHIKKVHTATVQPLILSSDVSLNIPAFEQDNKWVRLTVYKRWRFQNSQTLGVYNAKAEEFRVANDPDKFQIFSHGLSIPGWKGNHWGSFNDRCASAVCCLCSYGMYNGPEKIG